MIPLQRSRPDTIVLDLEIANEISHVITWDRTDLMKIACVVVYHYNHNMFEIFSEHDIDRLRSLIITSDLIVGYNIIKFDLPIIFGERSGRSYSDIHVFDILASICKNLGLDPREFSNAHKGWSLNAVAKATLGMQKSGQGAIAPVLWKQGRYIEVINYCMHDVMLTRNLYDHIKQEGWAASATTRTSVRWDMETIP